MDSEKTYSSDDFCVEVRALQKAYLASEKMTYENTRRALDEIVFTYKQHQPVPHKAEDSKFETEHTKAQQAEDALIASTKRNIRRRDFNQAQSAPEFDLEFMDAIMHAYTGLNTIAVKKGHREEKVPGDFYYEIKAACLEFKPCRATIDKVMQNYTGEFPDSEKEYGDSLEEKPYVDPDASSRDTKYPEGWDPKWGEPPKLEQ